MSDRSRRRVLGVMLASTSMCLVMGGLSLLPAAALADSVTVSDADNAHASVDISWAQFTNGKKAVSLKAAHPGLRPGAEISIGIDVPGPLLFTAVGTGSRGIPYLSRWDENGEHEIRCPDARYKIKVADRRRHVPGKVRITVPQSCLKRTGRVKMAYAIGSRDYTHWDYAPNAEPGSEDEGRAYTGWIPRSKDGRPASGSPSSRVTGSRGEGVDHARSSVRHFLDLVNRRKFKVAANFTYEDADMAVVKRYRKRGFTFRSVHSCDIAPPEGYGCWADVRKRGASRGTFWAHTDGNDSTRYWKVWEFEITTRN